MSSNKKIIKLLLDKSGSMGEYHMFESLIEGSNSLLLEQKQFSEDTNTELIVEIYTFNNTLSKLRSGNVTSIKSISKEEVEPRGGTALNDSLAEILNEGKDEENVLLFIFTDGQENSSTQYRGESGRKYCKSLIEMYSRDKNWTVVFGAANIDAYKTSSDYGIDVNNVFNVDDTSAPSMVRMMRGISSAIKESQESGQQVDITPVRTASETPHPKRFKSGH